jgi:hypothetical protein
MKTIFVFLLIAVLALAGCTDQNMYSPQLVGPRGGGGEPGRTDVSYFPLAVGDSIGYLYDPNNYSSSTMYIYVASVQEAGVVKVYTIRNFGILEGETDSLFEVRANGDVYTVQSINPFHESLLLRTQVPVGTSWNVDSVNGMATTLDAAGVTVTTDAGTFTNCLHIVIANTGTEYWLAPNVGIVQYVPGGSWIFDWPSGGIEASEVRLKANPRILPVGAGLAGNSFLPFAVGDSIGYLGPYLSALTFTYVSGVNNYGQTRAYNVQNFYLPGNEVDTLFDVRPDGDVYTVENAGTDSMSESLLFRTNVPTGTTWLAPRAGLGVMAAWGETWTTEAGTFTNCAVIHLVSGIENDVYIFAPSVGVVYLNSMSMLGTQPTGGDPWEAAVVKVRRRYGR